MKIFSQLRWNQVLISLLIGFAIGAAFGQGKFQSCHRGPWNKGDMKQHMLDKFTRELHLTPDQRTQVSAIFERTHGQMEALRNQVKPQFEALRTATQNEIRPLLTPEQQTKFDQLNARMKERWEKRNKF